MSKKQIEKPQKPSQPKPETNPMPPAMQVFSRNRDNDGTDPYHLDGDL
jgi:hypothetical protein